MNTTAIQRAVIMMDQSTGELREDEERTVGIDIWPEVEKDLQTLIAKGVEVIMTIPADEAIGDIGDFTGWAGGIKFVTVPKKISYFDSSGFDRDGLHTDEMITAFVSSDRRLRGNALKTGFKPAPHVALLPIMAKGEMVEGVRLTGPRSLIWKLAQSPEILPMHFQPVTDSSVWALIALTTREHQLNAALQGVSVQALPFNPMTEDLIWIRIDSVSYSAREKLLKRKIVHAEQGQILLALKPEEGGQVIDFHGRHGHSEILFPDPNLLRPSTVSSIDQEAIDITKFPEKMIEEVAIPRNIRDILKLTKPPCSFVTKQYQEDLDRYTGVLPLDSAGTIQSRNVSHPDNQRVESALIKDLRAMGYCPYRQTFSHGGATLSNIIADFPGNGIFRIKKELLERYRKLLSKRPIGRVDQDTSFVGGKSGFPGAELFQNEAYKKMSDRELRARMEEIFRLHPWYPWWRRCLFPYGFGADLIIVGCHLDSTAGFELDYSPSTDPAPGRDDNGSGIAATLSIARYLSKLKGKLRHTVRFCFFNAEEIGLVGSKAYAAKMKSLNAPIRAVICTDMMGYNSDMNKFFEIHAGYTDPAIRDLSLPLASEIASAAAAYGQLAPAQLYKGTVVGSSSNRDLFDGAINRSDHAAFHQQGYAAVLVSEDFFANLQTEPGADPNPNYHREADDFVDLEYAKNITCAVNKAVIKLAV